MPAVFDRSFDLPESLPMVHVHIAIVTEVIQLPHSRQQACFINKEVWEHISLSFVAVKE